MTSSDLPPAAYAAALASLPGCSGRRLHHVLDASGWCPEQAWARLRAASTLDLDLRSRVGSGVEELVESWRRAAQRADVAAAWAAAMAAGIDVWVRGDDRYPARLVGDPDPPAVLFARGRTGEAGVLGAARRPAVAIVGTRRCTSYGSDVARDLGRGLAAAGVVVISGLALGIDGAAHEGALVAGGAPPVGVVGSGLDVVYPKRHRTLWRRVGEAGLLLSEAPPGANAEPWRFPRRNRILAALADVVVVVESHASGGSLSTVRAAVERGVAVMAVPGSVRSPSSAGTNRLLADGVAPVTDVQDVLVALSLEGATLPNASPPELGRPDPAPPAAAADPVLDAVDWTPTATEEILRRTGLGVAEGATRLARLEVLGLVRRRGGWWERAVAPGAATDGGYTATT